MANTCIRPDTFRAIWCGGDHAHSGAWRDSFFQGSDTAMGNTITTAAGITTRVDRDGLAGPTLEEAVASTPADGETCF